MASQPIDYYTQLFHPGFTSLSANRRKVQINLHAPKPYGSKTIFKFSPEVIFTQSGIRTHFPNELSLVSHEEIGEYDHPDVHMNRSNGKSVQWEAVRWGLPDLDQTSLWWVPLGIPQRKGLL